MVNYRGGDGEIRQDCVTIWGVLVRLAPEATSITYQALANATGIPFGKIRDPIRLGRIRDYCLNNGLPRLDALVVRSKVDLPGDGFLGRAIGRNEWEEIRRRVRNANYPLNLTAEDFRQGE